MSLANALYWRRMIPKEKYWVSGGKLYRQRSDKLAPEVYVNAVWSTGTVSGTATAGSSAGSAKPTQVTANPFSF